MTFLEKWIYLDIIMVNKLHYTQENKYWDCRDSLTVKNTGCSSRDHAPTW